MPRRSYKKLSAKPDLIYNSFDIAKLINYAMKDGKKSVASKHVYFALEKIKKKKLDPIDILQKAIVNTSPNMEVKPRRVGGASYLVPIETRVERKTFLSLNWIIQAANSRPNKQYKSFGEKLFAEIMDAYQDQGGAVEKRKNTEKLAEANRAFAHFKW